MARFTVESVTVGQGGFGKVRRGFDTQLNRDVAIKSLEPSWSDPDPTDKERFRREAQTLASLSHQNIPAIYDILDDEGELRIVFQFIQGKNLREIMADNNGSIPLEEARRWFLQLASALGHAHAKSIIHRDIKPENMIVTSDNKHCYLVDFGIALSKDEMSRLTGSDEWIGTPGYMSPEQQDGEILDESDDVFVLGCCLYEVLGGHRIDTGSYQSLSEQNELIPPQIDQLVKRCIAPKPSRLNSAEKFAELLGQSYGGHRPLSEVLWAGQLHEIVYQLKEMNPTQFMDLKAGQRMLILQKCHDVVRDEDHRLDAARVEFLSVMIVLGLLLPNDDYEKIVSPAINFAFGIAHDDGVLGRGSYPLRASLEKAAVELRHPNHGVFVRTLLQWANAVDVSKQRAAFCHAMRTLVTKLMANTECEEGDAIGLASLLAQVNEHQRSLKATAHNFDDYDDF